ncbi:hypothetical protein GALMADRAFT_135582 [Galerina marginata CBS 339.88]|uniref:Uncharacterized protein n=1 Tax=Galerina marginata (strain CBS 339.88) TaxID=685588 RepID=A0A067TG68_GALM3|nr:hypothetical protein GALMADRAFT_135582 [Galerina marginata CBS 339.88]
MTPPVGVDGNALKRVDGAKSSKGGAVDDELGVTVVEVLKSGAKLDEVENELEDEELELELKEMEQHEEEEELEPPADRKWERWSRTRGIIRNLVVLVGFVD